MAAEVSPEEGPDEESSMFEESPDEDEGEEGPEENPIPPRNDMEHFVS